MPLETINLRFVIKHINYKETIKRTDKMYVAIVGSREWRNLQIVVDYVNSLSRDTVVISGAARGVDTAAENTALERGMRVITFKPDWDSHGRSAGMIRNQQIVANAEELVAFWDGHSKGTRHSIETALNAANIKKVTVIKE